MPAGKEKEPLVIKDETGKSDPDFGKPGEGDVDIDEDERDQGAINDLSKSAALKAADTDNDGEVNTTPIPDEVSTKSGNAVKNARAGREAALKEEAGDLGGAIGHNKFEGLQAVLAKMGWSMDDVVSVEWSDKWVRVYNGKDERRVNDS